MSPEAFAARHPRLWRLACAGALAPIRTHGLRCARSLATLAGHDLSVSRRATAVDLTLPDGTRAQITDNSPLSEARLARLLDDGLTPAEWMAMLNARVFFWPDPRLGLGNLAARDRFGYTSEWHVFDTYRLLAPVWDRAEIAPFNTGATVRLPPRRGRSTFAALAGLDYTAWRRARRDAGRIKGLDSVREVTVRGDLLHAAEAVLETRPARASRMP